MAKKILPVPVPVPDPDRVLDREFELEAAFSELAERARQLAGPITRSKLPCSALHGIASWRALSKSGQGG
jgi:hypothetical protein